MGCTTLLLFTLCHDLNSYKYLYGDVLDMQFDDMGLLQQNRHFNTDFTVCGDNLNVLLITIIFLCVHLCSVRQ